MHHILILGNMTNIAIIGNWGAILGYDVSYLKMEIFPADWFDLNSYFIYLLSAMMEWCFYWFMHQTDLFIVIW